MKTKIIMKGEIREAALTGIRKLALVVGRTLGPGGLPILLQREGQALDGSPRKPKITKDGVSVAEQCFGDTPEEDVIIQTVKDICRKTNADVGDGTTTAILLGHALVEESYNWLKEGDTLISPQELRRSLEAAGDVLMERLKVGSQSVKSNADIARVATISANGDMEIGDIIAEAFEAVGAEGVITVDEGSGLGLTLDVVEGYRFDRGAQARQNFFNNKDLTAFEASDVSVVLYDGEIRSHLDLVPLLLMQAQVNAETGEPGRPFPPTVIIANEFSRDVLQFLLIQKAERGLSVCPVVGPNLTHIRTGYYDDLAAFVGGTRLGNGNRSLSNISEADIGTVGKVSINGYHSTLFNGGGEEANILKRVDHLSALRDSAESSYDAQICSDRIAALTSGIAKILVGGATEVEILEKYDRIEDALNSARAAIQEGVLVGGGCSLVRLTADFDSVTNPGQHVLQAACFHPLNTLLDNTGMGQQDLKRTVDRIRQVSNSVFDAKNMTFLPDGHKAGIIDPVAVTRAALRNALSIAGLILTLGGAVVSVEEEK